MLPVGVLMHGTGGSAAAGTASTKVHQRGDHPDLLLLLLLLLLVLFLLAGWAVAEGWCCRLRIFGGASTPTWQASGGW
jgi:hypothetical protein